MRNLNVHNLKKSLNCLCSRLRNQYNINEGGCCLIAYYIALHLDKLGLKYELVIYDRTKRKDISQEIRNRIKAKNTSYSITGHNTCNHYCIYLVGGGIINRDDYRGCFKYTIGTIQAKNIKWIYKSGNWNSTYNTRNNKVIKTRIDAFFKKHINNV